MSSNLSPCSLRRANGPTTGHEPVPWIWPVGSRAVLTGLVIAAALGLAIASRSVPQSASDAIVAGPDLVLDPNTAPPRVLETLPHVGRTLVQQIVAARADRPFRSLDDARRRVRGLGPATLAKLAPYLSFAASSAYSSDQPVSSDDDLTGAKPRSTRRKKARPAPPEPASSRLAARFPELIPLQDIATARHE